MRLHVNYRFLFTYRIISAILILLLTYLQAVLLLEYKLYLPGSLRLVVLVSVGFIILFFLIFVSFSIFFSDRFYFILRNFFTDLKFTNLHDLYRFLNDLQLKKFFVHLKKYHSINSFHTFTTEKVHNSFKFIDVALIAIILLLVVSFFPLSNTYFEAADRIIHFKKTFSPPDLLIYTYSPEELIVEENESLEFSAYITGQYVPDYVFFVYEGIKYKVPVVNRSFSFKFNHITRNFDFVVQNLSLNHRRLYSVKCIPKVYFENYYVVVNKPLYIGGGTDTIYDFVTATYPEFSTITVNLKWHGSAHLLINGSSVSRTDSSHTFTFKPNEISGSYKFELTANNTVFDSLFLSVIIINDLAPQLSINRDSKGVNGIISLSDDFGLEKGTFSFVKVYRGKSSIISTSSLNLKNFKNFNFYFSDLDTIKLYDTLKVITSVKDNCPFRAQIVNNEFILLTQDDRFASTISYYDSVNHSYQKSLSNVDNLQQILNRIRNSVGNNSRSDYSKEINLQSLHNNVENLKSLNTNSSQTELNRLVQLIDSILQQISNPLSNQLTDPIKLENIKKLLELSELLKDKIEQAQQLMQSQIIELLKKEIESQLKANNDALNKLKNSSSDESLDKDLELLQKNNLRLIELANKLKNSSSDALQKQLVDSLNNVSNRYDSLKKSSSSESQKANQLSKVSQTYQNVSDLLDKVGQTEDKIKSLNYNTLVNLIKRSTLLSQAIENSTYSDFSRFSNQWLANSSAQSFVYFEKYWNQFRDSLMTFVRESDLPVTFFIENVFRIDRSSEKVRRALRNNNSLEVGKNSGEVMEGLNKITLAITELLDSKEDDNSIQMDGQQCMKPKKGGSKGKPKPNRSLQDIIQQLQQINQQMNSMGSSGKQKTMDGKMLLELVNQQQMLREALSELMNQAENKTLGKLLQEAMDEMKRNEKQLIDQRMVDNSLINRQQKILTRLLEAQKAREEQEFENRRESKDFGHYVRPWSDDNFSKPDTDKKSFNELLKPNQIGIRKYYQDKQAIYQTLKQ